MQVNGAAPVSFTYDADGLLTGAQWFTARVNGALAQGFLYQGQLRPVAEPDGAGTVVS